MNGLNLTHSHSTSTNWKSYDFTSPSGGSGTFFNAGYYKAPAAHVVLTIGASVTQTLGSANEARGAYAFIVASGAGGASVLTVTGTSITDAGVRNAGDSEIIVANASAALINVYFETIKKWIGQVTFTLTGGAGSFTFNYGFVKYEDFGNRDFTITDFEAVGRCGGNDSAFNIGLIHHKATGWTYSAGAFSAGPGFLVDMNTDYNTEINITNGEEFAYKRAGLSTVVKGNNGEGIIVCIVTGANNAVEQMTAHVGIIL